MAAAYVRDTGRITAAGATSAAGSFGALPSLGNMVAVLTSLWNDSGATPLAAGNVTDNQASTYELDVEAGPAGAGGNMNAGIFSDKVIGSPSGTFTVTINPTGASHYIEGIAAEFSGIEPSSTLDQTAPATGTNASPTVTSDETTQADELVLGVIGASDGSATDLGIDADANFTTLGSIIQNAFDTSAFYAGYRIILGTGAQTFSGGTLARNPSNHWLACVATYKAATGESGQTVEIGQTTETDSALAVTSAKTKSVGLNTETDSALAVVTGRTISVGQAEETDAPFALAGHTKAKAVGLNTETDSALATTVKRTYSVGLATATDSALSVSRIKTLLVGIATEADSALAIQGQQAAAAVVQVLRRAATYARVLLRRG